MVWDKRWLLDFSAGKLSWFCLTRPVNNNGSIDVKIDGSVLEEKSNAWVEFIFQIGLGFLHYLNC